MAFLVVGHFSKNADLQDYELRDVLLKDDYALDKQDFHRDNLYLKKTLYGELAFYGIPLTTNVVTLFTIKFVGC